MNPKQERHKEDENPFENLKIGNWEILDGIEERSLCKLCNKSRKYFCYTCYIPVRELEGLVPTLRLPVKIDIIKHEREIDGKSTAAHAAVLAPYDVKVSTYPFIPDYGVDEKVVLIYPSKNATSLESLFHFQNEIEGEMELNKHYSTNLPVTRAVFIDSTWNQSKGIYKDPRLRGLPCIILQARLSHFWRHQKGSPRWYLATVEAIHQFLVELHVAAWTRRSSQAEPEQTSLSSCPLPPDKIAPILPLNETGAETRSIGRYPYDGEYDNLLFFFRFMYSKIHKLYDHDKLLSYQRRLK